MKRPAVIAALALGLATSSSSFAQDLEFAHGFAGAAGTIRSILGTAEAPDRRARVSPGRIADRRGAETDEPILVVDPRSGRIVDVID